MLIKCNKCGKVLDVVKGATRGTMCCGEEMVEVKANSVDAATEKHIPTYEIREDKIIVKVNHVMEEEHYIEWISMESNTKLERVFLNPGDVAEAEFSYIPGSVIYSYCNKHSLWKADVM